MSVEQWVPQFEAKAQELYPASDPSHDVLHIGRVVKMARLLAAAEGADLNVVVPAAYLHDCVTVPKNDPRRKQASRLSAEEGCRWLAEIGYPAQYLPAISHAIAAHSFSAGIPPETIEAKVVQDADRLDAIGAVGIARLFTVAGLLGRPYYDPSDVAASTRAPDDALFSIDHFKVKLFGLADTMHTAAARREGAKRLQWMRDYYDRLVEEVAPLPT